MAVRAEKTLRELREQNTCKNIRSREAFIKNEGCGLGTIRSWNRGRETYVKLPGGVLRDVFADNNVQFAEVSGFRKSNHRVKDGDSGLLREKDGTMIEYSQLNITEPRDLYIRCRDASDEECIREGELMIGRPGGHVHYRVGDQWDQLLRSLRVASTADPVSRADVKLQRAAARAEDERKKREEVAERKAIREQIALEKLKARVTREERKEELDDELLRASVGCKNIRSIQQFKGNDHCLPGTIRNFKDKEHGQGYYLKLPDYDVRKLDPRNVEIEDGSEFVWDQPQRRVNTSLRYGVRFDCENETNCNLQEAKMKIGREGGDIVYDPFRGRSTDARSASSEGVTTRSMAKKRRN